MESTIQTHMQHTEKIQKQRQYSYVHLQNTPYRRYRYKSDS